MTPQKVSHAYCLHAKGDKDTCSNNAHTYHKTTKTGGKNPNRDNNHDNCSLYLSSHKYYGGSQRFITHRNHYKTQYRAPKQARLTQQTYDSHEFCYDKPRIAYNVFNIVGDPWINRHTIHVIYCHACQIFQFFSFQSLKREFRHMLIKASVISILCRLYKAYISAGSNLVQSSPRKYSVQ